MKLIDILNKIANGELKEGTKVKSKEKNEVFTLRTRDEYGTELDLFDEDNYSLLCDYWLIKILNEEVELIEPEHFTDAGKVSEHFREDTKMIEPECEHKWKRYSLGRLGQRTENHRYCLKCGADEIEPTDNTKIEELDIKKYYIPGLTTRNYDSDKAIIDIIDKLNEVIRYINKEE